MNIITFLASSTLLLLSFIEKAGFKQIQFLDQKTVLISALVLTFCSVAAYSMYNSETGKKDSFRGLGVLSTSICSAVLLLEVLSIIN